MKYYTWLAHWLDEKCTGYALSEAPTTASDFQRNATLGLGLLVCFVGCRLDESTELGVMTTEICPWCARGPALPLHSDVVFHGVGHGIGVHLGKEIHDGRHVWRPSWWGHGCCCLGRCGR